MKNNIKDLISYLEEFGKDLTYQELADRFGFNSSEQVRSIVRRYNKRKVDTEDLSSNAQISSYKVWQLPNGEERVSIKYDNNKVTKEQLSSFKKELVADLQRIDWKLPRYKYSELNDPNIVVVSTPDLHYGKLINNSKGKEVWGLDKAEKEYFSALQNLVQRFKGYNVERIVFPIGNDGFNSEGMRRTTTKGTPQIDNAEWQHIFRKGWQMQLKAINYLRQYAPVDVVIVQGNHDYEVTFYLGELLSVAAKQIPGVTVDNSTVPRKYYSYGKNLIGFTHGDKEKFYDLPLIMATERSRDFGKSTYREFLCGHWHKEMQNEYRGIKVRFLPSLVPSDAWHKMMGYHHSRAAQALIYSKDRGFEGLVQYNA